MIKKIEVKKEFIYLYLEEITNSTIDEMIDFVRQSKGGEREILIHYVKIGFNNFKPTSVSIGINPTGFVDEITISINKYYYFRGTSLVKCDSIDEIKP